MSTKFVGDYVHDIHDVLEAAAVSRVHTFLLGAPGSGKTSMARAAAQQMFGDGKWAFMRFNPTTSKERLEGPVDLAALMNIPSVERVIHDGTPYDENIRFAVLDELPRGNEMIFDMVLDLLDRWDVARADCPTIVATGNFLPKNERTEAMLDRFGMVYWTPQPKVDIAEFVKAQLGALNGTLEMENGLPDYQTIRDIWALQPTESTMLAVAKVVAQLADLASQGLIDNDSHGKTVVKRQFGVPNMRRMTYWTHILYRLSAYYWQKADFTAVHDKALRACSYAWMTRSQDEFNDWRTLVGSIVDPFQAAIDRAMQDAYQALQKEVTNAGGIVTPKERKNVAMRLFQIIQPHLANIQMLVGGDDKNEKFVDAATELHGAVSKFVESGKIGGESNGQSADTEVPF